MKICLDCGEQNLDFRGFCQKCGASLKQDNYSALGFSSQTIDSPSPVIPDNCQFSMVFYVLSWLILLGGVVGVFILWPYRVWDVSDLIPPLTALISGIIPFALFYAIGKTLNYLHWISCYLCALTHFNNKMANSIKTYEVKE